MTILYEDRDLVCAVKPFGVLSQDGGEGSMPVLLHRELGGEIYPVHRLDRETGGGIVFARNERAAAKISALVSERNLEKEYLTVVQGLPEEESAVLRDLLFRDAQKNKTYVVNRMRRGVREAELEYCRLETVRTEKGELSLLRVRLHTGRTHQIRVHMASIGHPVLGDPVCFPETTRAGR